MSGNHTCAYYNNDDFTTLNKYIYIFYLFIFHLAFKFFLFNLVILEFWFTFEHKLIICHQSYGKEISNIPRHRKLFTMCPKSPYFPLAQACKRTAAVTGVAMSTVIKIKLFLIQLINFKCKIINNLSEKKELLIFINLNHHNLTHFLNQNLPGVKCFFK